MNGLPVSRLLVNHLLERVGETGDCGSILLEIALTPTVNVHKVESLLLLEQVSADFLSCFTVGRLKVLMDECFINQGCFTFLSGC